MAWAKNYLFEREPIRRVTATLGRAAVSAAKWTRPTVGWLKIGPTRKQRRRAMERV
jgi:hypothetical protein